MSYNKGYNDVMEKAILEKYGMDVLLETQSEAQRVFEGNER